MCGSSDIDGMVIVLLGRMMILYNSEWAIFKTYGAPPLSEGQQYETWAAIREFEAIHVLIIVLDYQFPLDSLLIEVHPRK
jgi:hypothetical protein